MMNAKMLRFRSTVCALGLTLLSVAGGWADTPQVVTLDSASPLLEIRVMVKVGSSVDPDGMEGLAAIASDAVLEAGFGPADAPVTKELLAEITAPWGSGARPGAFTAKQAITYSMTVPRDVLDEFVERIFQPMFTAPHFEEAEVERLVRESETYLSGQLRYQNIEMLGLEAMDNYVFDGTSYAHTMGGSVEGLSKVNAEAVRAFYAEFFRPENMILGVSTKDPSITSMLTEALEDAGKPDGKKARLSFSEPTAPEAVQGRELTVLALPDAGATGIHAGFPIDIDRTHPDFPALYVASVYFGTHRDGHGHLYEQIRQERGYNYGDYAYVEHFAYRPYYLFPPFNTPRNQQYFSMWIRPVGDEYAHHLLKAAVYELENLVNRGISAEDVEASKNKARVLYLNLAETSARLLEARLDDAYYGMEPGYLDGYLERIDAVTAEQVNAAVRNYLQSENLKILVVTDAEKAQAFADDVAHDRNSLGKSLEDYQIVSAEVEGEETIQLPISRLTTIQRDAVWASYHLGIDPSRIRVVPVEAVFETGDFVAKLDPDAGAR